MLGVKAGHAVSIAVSSNYRRLDPAEVPALAAELADAWKSPDIPQLQYDMAVKAELEAVRRGDEWCAPFGAFYRCMERLLKFFPSSWPSLLDVGASGGYYSELLSLLGWDLIEYTGIDFSPAFKELAERLYPGIKFDVGDARTLPYPDNSFEIMLHAAVLMHVFDYQKAIQEAARVASQYCIFHRTPIVNEGPMQFWEKDAYGVRTIELHFNEYELLNLFDDCGLDVIYEEPIFKDANHRHVSYLLAKR